MLYETFLEIQRTRVAQRLTVCEQRALARHSERPRTLVRKRGRAITTEDRDLLDASDEDDFVRSTDALDHGIEPLDGVEHDSDDDCE